MKLLIIHKLQRLHRWSLGMDKLFHPTLYNRCNDLSMLGWKLNHVSKKDHSNFCANPILRYIMREHVSSLTESSKYTLLISRVGLLKNHYHHLGGKIRPGGHLTSDYTKYKVVDKITYPFPNFNGAAIAVWEYISNFIPPFTGHLFTYPRWD